MAWLTTLLQMIPAVMAAISQIAPLIQAIINMLNHRAAVAAGGLGASETEWWLYGPGQIAAGTLAAIIVGSLQPRANAMARAWYSQSARESLRAKLFEINEQIALLPAEHQARLGK